MIYVNLCATICAYATINNRFWKKYFLWWVHGEGVLQEALIYWSYPHSSYHLINYTRIRTHFVFGQTEDLNSSKCKAGGKATLTHHASLTLTLHRYPLWHKYTKGDNINDNFQDWFIKLATNLSEDGNQVIKKLTLSTRNPWLEGFVWECVFPDGYKTAGIFSVSLNKIYVQLRNKMI